MATYDADRADPIPTARQWADSARGCAIDGNNMTAAIEAGISTAWATISIAESLRAIAAAVSSESPQAPKAATDWDLSSVVDFLEAADAIKWKWSLTDHDLAAKSGDVIRSFQVRAPDDVRDELLREAREHLAANRV